MTVLRRRHPRTAARAVAVAMLAFLALASVVLTVHPHRAAAATRPAATAPTAPAHPLLVIDLSGLTSLLLGPLTSVESASPPTSVQSQPAAGAAVPPSAASSPPTTTRATPPNTAKPSAPSPRVGPVHRGPSPHGAVESTTEVSTTGTSTAGTSTIGSSTSGHQTGKPARTHVHHATRGSKAVSSKPDRTDRVSHTVLEPTRIENAAAAPYSVDAGWLPRHTSQLLLMLILAFSGGVALVVRAGSRRDVRQHR